MIDRVSFSICGLFQVDRSLLTSVSIFFVVALLTFVRSEENKEIISLNA